MATARELIIMARNQMLRDRLLGSFKNDEFNLWQNDELLEYLNEAENEACIRSRLLVDSETTGICTISVKAEKAVYHLSELIHVIERAKLSSQNTPLTKKSTSWLDDNIVDWDTRTGRVDYYVQDMHQIKLRLVGIPEEDDTLSLQVWRKPLQPMGFNDPPEIAAHHHRHLLHWICHLAYLKENSNTYDKEKSDYHGSLFASFFGDRPNAEQLEARRRHYKARTPARFF